MALSLSGLTAFGQEPSAGVANANEYAKFLEMQESREDVALTAEISLLEVRYTGTDNKASSVGASSVSFGGGFEKWVRWELPMDKLVDYEQATPELVIENSAKTVRPAIDLSDGTRTLNLSPDQKDPQLWRGLLRPKIDRTMRRGGVNCGLYFGEQLLTEYLKSFTLTEVQTDAESATFSLHPRGNGVPSTDVVYVEVRKPDYAPKKIIWNKGTNLVLQATASEYVVFDKATLVSRGEILFNYQPQSRIATQLSYTKREIPQEQRTLGALPVEIPSSSSAAIIGDEATGARMRLGNEAILSKYPDPKPETDTESEPSGQLWGRIGMLVGGAAVLGVLSWRSRKGSGT